VRSTSTRRASTTDGHATGALPNGKKARALTTDSLSVRAGNRCQRSHRPGDGRRQGQRCVKWCATHMNMKLPPDRSRSRKGRENVLQLIRTLFENGGYHMPVQRC